MIVVGNTGLIASRRLIGCIPHLDGWGPGVREPIQLSEVVAPSLQPVQILLDGAGCANSFLLEVIADVILQHVPDRLRKNNG